MSKLSGMSGEEITKATEEIKNKTREVGKRIMKKCDETEDLAELTEIMLDDQTKSMESIIDNLTELDQKVQESKSLVKQFASFFGIFQSTKQNSTHYVIKNEKYASEKNKNIMPEKKEKQNYDFKSDDPAEEIAIALEQKIDKLAMHANKFNSKINKQQPLLDDMSNKIEKSDCDIKNVTKTIKRY